MNENDQDKPSPRHIPLADAVKQGLCPACRQDFFRLGEGDTDGCDICAPIRFALRQKYTLMLGGADEDAPTTWRFPRAEEQAANQDEVFRLPDRSIALLRRAAQGLTDPEWTELLAAITAARIARRGDETTAEEDLLRAFVDTTHAAREQQKPEEYHGLSTGLVMKRRGAHEAESRKAFQPTELLLPPSRLTVVCARTGFGKSTLARTLVINALTQDAMAVLIGTEDSRLTHLNETRRGVIGAGLNGCDVATTQPEEWARACQWLANKKGFAIIDDQPRMSRVIEMLKAFSQICARANQPGIFVVDYLQHIPTGSGRDARHEQLAEAVEQLRRATQDCGVSVLVTAQIGRGGGELRSDYMDWTQMIAESDAVGKSAHQLMVIASPTGKAARENGESKIILVKARESHSFAGGPSSWGTFFDVRGNSFIRAADGDPFDTSGRGVGKYPGRK